MIRLRLLSYASVGLGLVLTLTLLLMVAAGEAQAQGGGDEDGSAQRMQPIQDRLAPPHMPAEPAQADLGAYDYYLTCMACHGDRGQGLTDEWRSAWSEGDQNCWQSKCHAANHPPEGFRLPYTVPPVIGQGLLARYETAGNLHNYISTRMPWHMPGSLDETQYWQLTAFLASANNLLPHDIVLTPENAGSLRLAMPSEREAGASGAAAVSQRASSQPAADQPAAEENAPQPLILPDQATQLRRGVGAVLLVGSSLVLVAALATGIIAAAKRS